MKTTLSTNIRYLKGIGPNKAKLFNKAGVDVIEDLFYKFPRRYENRSNLVTISQLEEGKPQTIKASVLKASERKSWKRRRFSIQQATVTDDTGKLTCVWFNQYYLKNYFKPGQTFIFYGKVDRYSGRLQMSSPEFELISEDDDEEYQEKDTLVPIYTLPDGLTQRYFRKVLKRNLDEHLTKVVDVLPYDIRKRENLLNLVKSLQDIHFPSDLSQTKEAYRRLAFEEFFLFQLLVYLRKLKKKQRQGLAHKVDGILSNNFLENLPFELTRAQKRVVEEIKKDMAAALPMSRLLQGDVGSGKTIVAMIASLFAVQTGYQVAFMVPTELLAQQHYQSSLLLLKDKINTAVLVGSLTKSKKEKLHNEIAQGKIQLIIGTHSLLDEKLKFKNLGLVVVDEQHKFGVAQRALLPKRGSNPDVLIMTATPIPRTLAITLYGDLDISVIDELPPSRKPVGTKFIPADQRKDAYKFIENEAKLGRQVYIIYPIIEESFTLDLRAASKMYDVLRKEVFPQFRIGLIHGQLKAQEQDKIMSKFKTGQIDILVATTVLEVGIDVPNATMMVVEHAERFGLSQLHQLRGRIGRGEHESYCILISHPQTKEAKLRIKAMVQNSDGFSIAEEDLKIRGPGEFFGSRQHGLSELRIADPLKQIQLLKQARQEAKKLIDIDSNLSLRQNLKLHDKLKQRFSGYEEYVAGG